MAKPPSKNEKDQNDQNDTLTKLQQEIEGLKADNKELTERLIALQKDRERKQ